jgi:DNA-binding MarR family transcriptional regulator
MDADIDRVHGDGEIGEIKSAWVMELLRLDAHGPMTITELARSTQRTHSAMSQKVAAMRTAGLVRTTTGADARSIQVTLSPKARQMVDQLGAEWRATEAAISEIEAEIPYPLSRIVTDIEEALERRSFYDRISEKLAEDPAWRQRPGTSP